MKRIVEKPMTREERQAYYTLETLNLVDNYFLARALELCPEGRLLDVGCGNGKMLRSVRGNYELQGIDIDEGAIAEAKDIGGNISYISAPAKEIPYESGSFDIVMCHSTLHHMEEPTPAVEEMLRVAKPEGAVFIRDLTRPADEFALQRFFLGPFAAHYDETNKKLFADSLKSSFEYSEWQGFFPPDMQTSQVLFYNLAERPAEGVNVDQQAKNMMEFEFIARRRAAPIIG